MLSSRSLAVSFLLFARARHIDLLVELDNRFNGRFENVNDTPHTDADPHTALPHRHRHRGGAGGIGDRRGRSQPSKNRHKRTGSETRARACDHANPRLARNRSAGTQVRTPLIHSDPG